jgi:hypothetical protein
MEEVGEGGGRKRTGGGRVCDVTEVEEAKNRNARTRLQWSGLVP